MRLEDLLTESARRSPSDHCVVGPDGTLTYADLDRMGNRVARALWTMGVRPGDRVGIWAEKSTRVVGAMQGILRCGAAYVPVDPLSPAVRALSILSDCGVKAVVTTPDRLETVGSIDSAPHLSTQDSLFAELLVDVAPPQCERGSKDDIAYILYTSGSTGKPKGVCISHRNALAFILWATEALGALATDRLSNHAPMHFDLSVLDLYVAIRAGAVVALSSRGRLVLAAEFDAIHSRTSYIYLVFGSVRPHLDDGSRQSFGFRPLVPPPSPVRG